MTTKGSLDPDAPFDALALVEANIRGDYQAMKVLTENCDMSSVISMLVIFLSLRLTEPDNRPAQVWLEGMRGVFAEAFWDVPA